ncbi:cell surface protein [Metasolibacillus meyeri]|uniref:Cell surface protein n=1 Tax=Metasolibacillus meyeri TaxID=1071052 RepID=A0AAW9NLK6_9BACL|nr:cell surface protein [Metasolibacillus meyeri]MEC1178260.1 cell surface protein [Metasolibacillus meyeri]
MKLFNRGTPLVCTALLFTFALFGCSENVKDEEIVVAPLHATYSIDVSNINAVVGDADNVFVGYVEKLEGTEYKFPVTVETEDGTKEVAHPYTNYSITVIDNIKGALKADTTIPVQKSGGLSEDQDMYILYENDMLPVEGKYYIFNTYNQPDGSILISGVNSNIELNSLTRNNDFSNTKEFKEYKTAVKNQVMSDRERFETNNYSE